MLKLDRPGFIRSRESSSSLQQRDFATWKACIDLRIARLWPGRSCESIGVDDVQLAWRWLEDRGIEEVARELVLERNEALTTGGPHADR